MATDDSRDDEFEALKDAQGVDPAKIAEQINKKKGITADPSKPDPNKPDPAKPDPAKPDPAKPDPLKEVPNPEIIRAAMLNEMFGEQFKTMEDFKKANIPASLQELSTLREEKKKLEAQLLAKPKHNFASDDIAKFNEFARETGIKDSGVFNKINALDVANMASMDALVLQHIIENPELAGKEPQVRKYFEKKYDVDSSKIDPKRVESGDLTQEEFDKNKMEYDANLIGVVSDGNKAKDKIKSLKEKIKMPDVSAEEKPAEKAKWTPEVEKTKKEEWTAVNEAMVKEFEKIPIPLKGSKEPLINFVLPEESKKAIMANAINIVVSNQMEVNEANVKAVATQMYSEAILSNLDGITHAIFERARSMKEEEYLKLYHNPSSKNTDSPPPVDKPLTADEMREKAYQAELDRLK